MPITRYKYVIYLIWDDMGDLRKIGTHILEMTSRFVGPEAATAAQDFQWRQ